MLNSIIPKTPGVSLSGSKITTWKPIPRMGLQQQQQQQQEQEQEPEQEQEQEQQQN